MDSNQENFLSMCVTLQETANTNNQVWNNLTAFVSKYSVFNTKVSELNSLKEVQEKNITGFAVDKSNKKSGMIEKTLKVIAGLKAYSLDKNDPVILNEISYTRSKLESARDEEVASKCQIVHDRANSVLTLLADYGIVADDLTELQSSIGNYSVTSQLPSSKIDERQAVTARIGDVINEIKETLGVMDNLVNTLNDKKPDFVLTYNNSRAINALKGGRSSNGENKSVANPSAVKQ